MVEPDKDIPLVCEREQESIASSDCQILVTDTYRDANDAEFQSVA